MKLPIESDINIYNSQDEIVACEHFLDKTLEQAEILFQENSSYYQEDLMWMGPQAFNFYLQSVINYLKSDHSVNDDHLIDCLYEIVIFRMEEEEFSIAIDRVQEMTNYVISNYEKFNIDSDIYGDLLAKYKELKKQLVDMS